MEKNINSAKTLKGTHYSLFPLWKESQFFILLCSVVLAFISCLIFIPKYNVLYAIPIVLFLLLSYKILVYKFLISSALKKRKVEEVPYIAFVLVLPFLFHYQKNKLFEHLEKIVNKASGSLIFTSKNKWKKLFAVVRCYELRMIATAYIKGQKTVSRDVIVKTIIDSFSFPIKENFNWDLRSLYGLLNPVEMEDRYTKAREIIIKDENLKKLISQEELTIIIRYTYANEFLAPSLKEALDQITLKLPEVSTIDGYAFIFNNLNNYMELAQQYELNTYSEAFRKKSYRIVCKIFNDFNQESVNDFMKKTESR